MAAILHATKWELGEITSAKSDTAPSHRCQVCATVDLCDRLGHTSQSPPPQDNGGEADTNASWDLADGGETG